MDNRERMLVFKRECRRYDSLLTELYQMNERHESIVYRINGVHSMSFEDTIKQTSRYHKSIIGKLEAKQLIEVKQNVILSIQNWILNAFLSIPYPSYRPIAWRVYVMSDSYETIGEEYNTGEDRLRREITDFLLTYLTDERMDEIQNLEDLYDVLFTYQPKK